VRSAGNTAPVGSAFAESISLAVPCSRDLIKPETFAQLRITGKVLGQDFNGDRALEARVLGAIDLAHSSGTESGQNLVAAETRAGGKSHGLVVTALIAQPANRARLVE
jgi:hypothetical protein